MEPEDDDPNEEEGPANVIYWGPDLEARLTTNEKEDLLAIATSEWEEFEMTRQEQYGIRKARDRKAEAKRMWNNSLPSRKKPFAPAYQEFWSRPPTPATRRVNMAGTDNGETREDHQEESTILAKVDIHPATLGTSARPGTTATPVEQATTRRLLPRRSARDGPDPRKA